MEVVPSQWNGKRAFGRAEADYVVVNHITHPENTLHFVDTWLQHQEQEGSCVLLLGDDALHYQQPS